jgi:hypothetical protein
VNAADQTLLTWLNTQIHSGKRTIPVPAELLKHTTSEGLAEARRLAKLCGCTLVVSA